MSEQRYSAAVLRNRGVPVTLGLTRQEVVGSKTVWTLERGPDESPLTTLVYVRFDNNTLAEIEVQWGSSRDWQVALNAKPVTTMRRTLALALDREDRDVGAALLPEHQADYVKAVMVAWGLASGLDPQKGATVMDTPLEVLVAEAEPQTTAD